MIGWCIASLCLEGKWLVVPTVRSRVLEDTTAGLCWSKCNDSLEDRWAVYCSVGAVQMVASWRGCCVRYIKHQNLPNVCFSSPNKFLSELREIATKPFTYNLSILANSSTFPLLSCLVHWFSLVLLPIGSVSCYCLLVYSAIVACCFSLVFFPVYLV